MNPKLQTRVQRYGWDKAAPYYDAGWKESLAPAQHHLFEMATPKSGEHVLDLACGTGLVTFPIADAVGKDGHVVATDLSDIMVECIRTEATRRSSRNVDAFRANAEDLSSIDDGIFDLVTCALGLMYCPEPMNAMRETLRVLKPGGRATFAVWGARKACGWADIFPIVDSRVKSDVCPMFFRLGTGDTLEREMSECGFENVECNRLSVDLPYDGNQSAVDAAFLGGPVAMAYDRFDATTKREAEAEYVRSIETYRTETGFRIPGEFVVCSGMKTRACNVA